ncbi:MAG: flavin reductase [Chloroflexi bacterium]|nr:flavin reductase [Chloroflexota bacterium]
MTTSSSGIDTRLFRDVCGNFATGVSVVTMVGESGPRGLTANAISALSLDPTLFLVCVDLGATSYPVIDEAGKFAINLLAEDQEDVSNFFAGTTPADNPMGEIEYHMSDLGSPLIEGSLAWLDCRTHSILDGGDHKIFVGEVASCEIVRPDADPLLFFRGRYRGIRPQ